MTPLLVFLLLILLSCALAATVTFNTDGEIDDNACIDGSDSCVRWKAAGECFSNPNYMLKECPKSCGLCGCLDEDDRCPHLAYHNQCTGKDEAYMFLKCKKSCKACGFDSDAELAMIQSHRRRLAAVGGNVALLETKYGVKQITTVSDGKTSTASLETIVKETEEYMENVVAVDSRYDTIKCYNHKPSCAYWKSTGACETNKVFMRQQCAPTCQVCIELGKQEYNSCVLD